MLTLNQQTFQSNNQREETGEETDAAACYYECIGIIMQRYVMCGHVKLCDIVNVKLFSVSPADHPDRQKAYLCRCSSRKASVSLLGLGSCAMVWNKVALSSSFISSGTQRRSRTVREGNVSSLFCFAVFMLCVKAETSIISERFSCAKSWF